MLCNVFEMFVNVAGTTAFAMRNFISLFYSIKNFITGLEE